MCDHKNDVAGTLLTARAGAAALGILPDSATHVSRDFGEHAARTRKAVTALADHPVVRADAPVALLIGCTYTRKATAEAGHAIEALAGLLRSSVALVDECCGLPLLYAGDTEGFAQQARLLAERVEKLSRVVVLDPGCASALRQRYAGVAAVRPAVELLVEVADGELSRFTSFTSASRETGRRASVRYHDPCQLGRGLGVYEAPRRVLGRALGRSPDEFPSEGSAATCSGAGGLLPVTMPSTSTAIAHGRMAEHRDAGGGEVVTACASSLLAFRKTSSAPVSDLVSWIARAVPRFRP